MSCLPFAAFFFSIGRGHVTESTLEGTHNSRSLCVGPLITVTMYTPSVISKTMTPDRRYCRVSLAERPGTICRTRTIKGKKPKKKRSAESKKSGREGPQKVPITRRWTVLALFALLKIMVTYISFNEGTRCFLATDFYAPGHLFPPGKLGLETMNARLLPLRASLGNEEKETAGKKLEGQKDSEEEATRKSRKKRVYFNFRLKRSCGHDARRTAPFFGI